MNGLHISEQDYDTLWQSLPANIEPAQVNMQLPQDRKLSIFWVG